MKSDSTRTTRTRELPRTTQLPWLSVRFMRNPIVSVHDVSCGYYTRDQPAKFLSRLAASFKTIKIDSRDLAARNVLVGEREKGVKWQTLGWPIYTSITSTINVFDLSLFINLDLFHKVCLKYLGSPSNEVDSLWGVVVWKIYHQKWCVSTSLPIAMNSSIYFPTNFFYGNEFHSWQFVYVFNYLSYIRLICLSVDGAMELCFSRISP